MTALPLIRRLSLCAGDVDMPSIPNNIGRRTFEVRTDEKVGKVEYGRNNY
jgi:hypothetical protein